MRRVSAAPRHLLMTADAVGGVWTHALELAAALAPLGVRTTLAVLGPGLDAARRARTAWRRGQPLPLEAVVRPATEDVAPFAQATLPACEVGTLAGRCAMAGGRLGLGSRCRGLEG